MQRSVDLLLGDIAVRAQRLKDLVQAETRESFLDSRRAQDSAERNLQVIGEALSQAIQQEPALTWQITETQKIIALRHLLTHHYYKVSSLTIWEIVVSNVPRLAHETANWHARYRTP